MATDEAIIAAEASATSEISALVAEIPAAESAAAVAADVDADANANAEQWSLLVTLLQYNPYSPENAHPLAVCGRWQLFVDPQALAPYYFNPASGESTWTAPEQWNDELAVMPPLVVLRPAAADATGSGAATPAAGSSSSSSGVGSSPVAGGRRVLSGWHVYRDPALLVQYFVWAGSGEARWRPPEDVLDQVVEGEGAMVEWDYQDDDADDADEQSPESDAAEAPNHPQVPSGKPTNATPHGSSARGRRRSSLGDTSTIIIKARLSALAMRDTTAAVQGSTTSHDDNGGCLALVGAWAVCQSQEEDTRGALFYYRWGDGASQWEVPPEVLAAPEEDWLLPSQMKQQQQQQQGKEHHHHKHHHRHHKHGSDAGQPAVGADVPASSADAAAGETSSETAVLPSTVENIDNNQPNNAAASSSSSDIGASVESPPADNQRALEQSQPAVAQAIDGAAAQQVARPGTVGGSRSTATAVAAPHDGVAEQSNGGVTSVGAGDATLAVGAALHIDLLHTNDAAASGAVPDWLRPDDGANAAHETSTDGTQHHQHHQHARPMSRGMGILAARPVTRGQLEGMRPKVGRPGGGGGDDLNTSNTFEGPRSNAGSRRNSGIAAIANAARGRDASSSLGLGGLGDTEAGDGSTALPSRSFQPLLHVLAPVNEADTPMPTDRPDGTAADTPAGDAAAAMAPTAAPDSKVASNSAPVAAGGAAGAAMPAAPPSSSIPAGLGAVAAILSRAPAAPERPRGGNTNAMPMFSFASGLGLGLGMRAGGAIVRVKKYKDIPEAQPQDATQPAAAPAPEATPAVTEQQPQPAADSVATSADSTSTADASADDDSLSALAASLGISEASLTGASSTSSGDAAGDGSGGDTSHAAAGAGMPKQKPQSKAEAQMAASRYAVQLQAGIEQLEEEARQLQKQQAAANGAGASAAAGGAGVKNSAELDRLHEVQWMLAKRKADMEKIQSYLAKQKADAAASVRQTRQDNEAAMAAEKAAVAERRRSDAAMMKEKLKVERDKAVAAVSGAKRAEADRAKMVLEQQLEAARKEEEERQKAIRERAEAERERRQRRASVLGGGAAAAAAASGGATPVVSTPLGAGDAAAAASKPAHGRRSSLLGGAATPSSASTHVNSNVSGAGQQQQQAGGDALQDVLASTASRLLAGASDHKTQAAAAGVAAAGATSVSQRRLTPAGSVSAPDTLMSHQPTATGPVKATVKLHDVDLGAGLGVASGLEGITGLAAAIGSGPATSVPVGSRRTSLTTAGRSVLSSSTARP